MQETINHCANPRRNRTTHELDTNTVLVLNNWEILLQCRLSIDSQLSMYVWATLNNATYTQPHSKGFLYGI